MCGVVSFVCASECGAVCRGVCVCIWFGRVCVVRMFTCACAHVCVFVCACVCVGVGSDAPTERTGRTVGATAATASTGRATWSPESACATPGSTASSESHDLPHVLPSACVVNVPYVHRGPPLCINVTRMDLSSLLVVFKSVFRV